MATDPKLLSDTTPLPDIATVKQVSPPITATEIKQKEAEAPKWLKHQNPPLPEGITLTKTGPSGAALLRYHGIAIKAFTVMPTTWGVTSEGLQFFTPTHVIDLPWTLIRELEFWGRFAQKPA